MLELYFVKYSLRSAVKQHAHMQHCIIQGCNDTHQGAPLTGKQTIRTRIDRTAVLANTVPYGIHITQNMHVQLKIATDNPQVTRKLKEFAKTGCACDTSAKLALRTSVTYLYIMRYH